MGRFPGDGDIDELAKALETDRELPQDPAEERTVYWHVFRRPEQVLDFARHILLDKGEGLVGGRTQDSIGSLWWVGVQVDDLEAWGNRRAIHKIDGVDPGNPGSPML